MKTITIYSTPTCPFCKQVKAYLKEQHIAFTDIDVSKDEKAQEEMIQKTGQMGVPVIIIDGDVVVGFDQEKIDRLLKK